MLGRRGRGEGQALTPRHHMALPPPPTLFVAAPFPVLRAARPPLIGLSGRPAVTDYSADGRRRAGGLSTGSPPPPLPPLRVLLRAAADRGSGGGSGGVSGDHDGGNHGGSIGGGGSGGGGGGGGGEDSPVTHPPADAAPVVNTVEAALDAWRRSRSLAHLLHADGADAAARADLVGGGAPDAAVPSQRPAAADGVTPSPSPVPPSTVDVAADAVWGQLGDPGAPDDDCDDRAADVAAAEAAAAAAARRLAGARRVAERARPPAHTVSVLFVSEDCERAIVMERSLAAAAAARGVSRRLLALSAGLDSAPGATLRREVVVAAAERGLDLTDDRPCAAFEVADLSAFDLVVPVDERVRERLLASAAAAAAAGTGGVASSPR